MHQLPAFHPPLEAFRPTARTADFIGLRQPIHAARRLRATTLSTVVLAGLLLAPFTTPATAESIANSAEAQRTWSFVIPAQDLSSALLAFSNQTGIQIVSKSRDVQGIKSPGVSGRMSAQAALDTLLGSTGLSYTFSGTNTVIVTNPASSVNEDGSVSLSQITVEALRGITSYLPTDGYVSYYSVAATKTDTPVIETPQSISTIGREEIEAHEAQTVAEAVRYTPGVAVDTYGVDPRGYDSITIRGFDSVTTGSFRDGLRMDGNFFAVYATEPYGIERIDMMRGPSGALYGQAEAGGVIDRTTKRPTADMVQEVQLEVGNWNRFQGAFDLGGALDQDGDVLFRLTGLVRESDTEFDYNDGTSQDNDRIYIAPALTWNIDENNSITLLTDYLKDKRPTQFGTYADEDIGRTHVVVGEPDFDKFEQEQYSAAVVFDHVFNERWKSHQIARYSRVDVDYQTVDYLSLESDGTTLDRYVWASPDTMEQFAIDNQLQGQVEWGRTSHTLLFGADFSRSVDRFSYYDGDADSIDLTNVVYTGASLPDPYQETRQTLTQAGAYVQDQIHFDQRWVLTLGGRYSWVRQKTEQLLEGTTETKTDDAFTGRAGLTYLFDSGFAPYISYTQGFVPTEGTNLSGESFAPQRSEQYEIGLKYQPPGYNALFTAALFDLTKTNVLTRDPADINASIQTGEIRTRGLELEAKASLFDGWDISASYTYVDAEVTRSNEEDLHNSPVTIPDHTASLWANYHFQGGTLRGLGMGAGVRYVGPSWNDTANTSRADDYFLVDATMDYNINRNLSLKLFANNLLDKEYITTCAYGACYYGSGRQVRATLTYRW